MQKAILQSTVSNLLAVKSSLHWPLHYLQHCLRHQTRDVNSQSIYLNALSRIHNQSRMTQTRTQFQIYSHNDYGETVQCSWVLYRCCVEPHWEQLDMLQETWASHSTKRGQSPSHNTIYNVLPHPWYRSFNHSLDLPSGIVGHEDNSSAYRAYETVTTSNIDIQSVTIPRHTMVHHSNARGASDRCYCVARRNNNSNFKTNIARAEAWVRLESKLRSKPMLACRSSRTPAQCRLSTRDWGWGRRDGWTITGRAAGKFGTAQSTRTLAVFSRRGDIAVARDWRWVRWEVHNWSLL